jgi:hypothetical protein
MKKPCRTNVCPNFLADFLHSKVYIFLFFSFPTVNTTFSRRTLLYINAAQQIPLFWGLCSTHQRLLFIIHISRPIVKKPAETQTSIRLAIHLVGAPNSRYGGHEFESQCGRNSVHWLKEEILLGSGHSTVVTPTWSHDHVSLSGCVTLVAWHIIGRLTCLQADSLARRHGRQ